MSEEERDHRQAFPYYPNERGTGRGVELRDYFAAQAIIALDYDQLFVPDGPPIGEHLSKKATLFYMLADALLEARKK